LDINASGPVTIDTPIDVTINSNDVLIDTVATLSLNAGTDLQLDGVTVDITATTANVNAVSGDTNIGNSLGDIVITSNLFDVNASGAITIDGATTTTLTSVGETEINSAALDINASGNVTIDTPADIITTSDQFLITTDTTTQKAIIHTSATNVDDYSGVNALNGYGIRISNTGAATGGLELVGYDTGTSRIETVGAGHSLEIKAGEDLFFISNDILELTSVETQLNASGVIYISSGLNTQIEATAGDVFINVADNTKSIQLQVAGDDYIMCSLAEIYLDNPTIISNRIGGQDKLVITSTTFDVTNDLTVSQTNYAQPMSSQFQLGYTNTATGSAVMTATLAQRATFTLPEKGVWLVVLGYQWTGGAANTITLKQAVISATTASATPAAPGLRYYEAIDTAVTAVLQQQGTIMGVYTATASTTLYLNALATVSASTLPTLAWSISWTRIG
jgi:hypothetical protein